MKKFALLASAALVGAAMADAPAQSVTGFYTGASVGLANTNVKYNTVNQGATAATTQNFTSDSGKAGLQYGMLGGYNLSVGSGAVVGVEVFFGGDSTKVKTSQDAGGTSQNYGNDQVKRNLYYGLAPRVGFMVTPNVLAYVRLGVEGGKWKADFFPPAASIDANAGTATASQIAAAKAKKNVTKNRVNFAPGAGLDVFASKNVFVRAQYHYVFGPKLTLNWPEMSPLNGGGLYNGTNQIRTFRISQHVLSLAIGYKF
jgi:opacity protein-like surface antigen